MPRYDRATACICAAVVAVLIWSGIKPHDRMTWWLEVTPALVGLVVLFAVRKNFRFTRLLQVLIALHMILLAVGGHYTYALVPLGNWMRDAFHLARNDYDRLGHVAQGLVPALIAREIMIRRDIVLSRGWTSFFAVCVAMTISALYELVEWLTALIYGSGADAFLGAQGDVWDTQEDMACALFGAICAVLIFDRWHDHQLAASRV